MFRDLISHVRTRFTTPTATAGSYPLTLTTTNAVGSSTRSFTLTYHPLPFT